MKKQEFDDIEFLNDISDIRKAAINRRTVHVLCTGGSLGFSMNHTRYNIAHGDYVILPNAILADGFSRSDDFSGYIMTLSDTYVQSIALRSNYGTIGHLALLQDPVMRLGKKDYEICCGALAYLRLRMSDTDHLFLSEMLGNILAAHILDLYDIHARSSHRPQVSERTATILRKFISMLCDGEYLRHRNLDHYASRLCITPHYLSEICRDICGNPASYWIDRFLMNDIFTRLSHTELTFSQIAESLNFSSLSYFSRYFQKHTGMTLSEFRAEIMK